MTIKVIVSKINDYKAFNYCGILTGYVYSDICDSVVGVVIDTNQKINLVDIDRITVIEPEIKNALKEMQDIIKQAL